LTNLRKKQSKAWEDEPFGGLSAEEKSEYDERTERINDLEKQLASRPQPDAASQEQKRGWSEDAETDTPQAEARQPYGSREKASGNSLTDSSKTGRRRRKNNSQNADP
jgi:hypothetical protein